MKKLFAGTMLGVLLAAAPAFAFDSVRATQGTVDRVDPAGQTLTLVGGMTLTIPSNISTALLAPGEEVTVTYQDGKNGQKELTAFWIDAGPGGDTRD